MIKVAVERMNAWRPLIIDHSTFEGKMDTESFISFFFSIASWNFVAGWCFFLFFSPALFGHKQPSGLGGGHVGPFVLFLNSAKILCGGQGKSGTRGFPRYFSASIVHRIYLIKFMHFPPFSKAIKMNTNLNS